MVVKELSHPSNFSAGRRPSEAIEQTTFAELCGRWFSLNGQFMAYFTGVIRARSSQSSQRPDPDVSVATAPPSPRHEEVATPLEKWS
jgi:hypothetical protein